MERETKQGGDGISSINGGGYEANRADISERYQGEPSNNMTSHVNSFKHPINPEARVASLDTWAQNAIKSYQADVESMLTVNRDSQEERFQNTGQYRMTNNGVYGESSYGYTNTLNSQISSGKRNQEPAYLSNTVPNPPFSVPNVSALPNAFGYPFQSRANVEEALTNNNGQPFKANETNTTGFQGNDEGRRLLQILQSGSKDDLLSLQQAARSTPWVFHNALGFQHEAYNAYQLSVSNRNFPNQMMGHPWPQEQGHHFQGWKPHSEHYNINTNAPIMTHPSWPAPVPLPPQTQSHLIPNDHLNLNPISVNRTPISPHLSPQRSPQKNSNLSPYHSPQRSPVRNETSKFFHSQSPPAGNLEFASSQIHSEQRKQQDWFQGQKGAKSQTNQPKESFNISGGFKEIGGRELDQMERNKQMGGKGRQEFKDNSSPNSGVPFQRNLAQVIGKDPLEEGRRDGTEQDLDSISNSVKSLTLKDLREHGWGDANKEEIVKPKFQINPSDIVTKVDRGGKFSKSPSGQHYQNRQQRRIVFNVSETNAKLSSLVDSLLPTTAEVERRNEFFSRLEDMVSRKWPTAKLHLYGSCANSFGVRNSDIDVCLALEDENAVKADAIKKIADILEEESMDQVQPLTHARVPIVKFKDPKSGISCDICANNMLAVANTKLLQDYARVDSRLRSLVFVVKHWAKCRQVNEAYRGTLSSYTYVIMCIHFLQQRNPPILPCLQSMAHTFKLKVGDSDCGYYDQVDELEDFGKANKESVAELLVAFFDYWAFKHDYNHSVISIRVGGFLSKEQKDWTRRIGNERHLICIEDPFEVTHDLGRVVDRYSIRVLRDEFVRATKILHNEKDPCSTLFTVYKR